MPAAQVREACGIPGTCVRTTWLCRDKPSMKEALRQAGRAHRGQRRRRLRRRGARVRRARAATRSSSSRAPAPAPRAPSASTRRRARAGAGRATAARARARSRSRSSSRATRASTTRSPSTATSSTTGRRTTTPTSSRRCATAGSRRSSSPPTGSTTRAFYAEVREIGRRVIEALGIETSATHMEWFYGPKGLRFSEIGCRPPGVGAWDLYSAANDVDVYREWAHAIVHGAPEQPMSPHVLPPASSRCAPTSDGPITGYSGIDEIQSPLRRVDHRRPLPARGTRHPAGRGRLHGQRLGADAPPRLRHRCAACSTTSAAPSTCTRASAVDVDDDPARAPSGSRRPSGPPCARSGSTGRSRWSTPAGRSARATTPSSPATSTAAASTSGCTTG